MNRKMPGAIVASMMAMAGCSESASLPTIAPSFAAHSADRGIVGSCAGTYTVTDPVFLPPPNDEELLSFVAVVEGECTLGHLGKAIMSARLLVTFDSDGIHENDQVVTLVGAAGDELHVLETATIGDFQEDGSFTFPGTWVVDGGTGRFEHAAGNLALSGSGNTVDQTSNRKIRGWISY